jgi:heavy metal translocating P-type ATPase
MKIIKSLFDKILVVILLLLLVFHYLKVLPREIDLKFLIIFGLVGVIPVIISTFNSIKNKKISVDLLASIALFASIIAKQWPSILLINLMLVSARLFGEYSENRSRAAINSLLKLRPQKIKIKQGKNIIEILAKDVKIGDLVVICDGERIPVDGIVEDGEATIDQSSLTGESLPVTKVKGNQVLSSTLNVSGSLIIKAQKIGKDTALEKIIDLVEKSQNNKPKITTTVDVFATIYVIVTIFVAILIYILFKDFNLILAFLLVVCADDIAVAIPVAFLAAIGYAARRGVIIKGGSFLEAMTKVKVIVVDKTGTLTIGKLRVEAIREFNNHSQDELLSLAAMTAKVSNHPIAKAILKYTQENKVKIEDINSFEEISGKGIIASYQGQMVISGKLGLLEEQQIKITDEQIEQIKKEQQGGYNITLIAWQKELIGYIALADEIRPGIEKAVRLLKKSGIKKFIMLTGDNNDVASRVARKIGIDEFHANLLPEDKINFLKKCLNKKYKVMMVGDGVNDAAALSLADIGVAMGVIGSDAAIESADIALMRDDFLEIPAIIELGRYIKKVAIQDFWIWGLGNALGIVLVFTKVIGPEGAAAYNFIADFLPLLNSLRIFHLHFKRRINKIINYK